MDKKELRQKYRSMRQALTLDTVEVKSLAIANNLLKLPIWDKTYYHVFLTIEEQKEVHTDLILHILSGKDKEIVISRSDFSDYSMKHYLLTDNTRLIKNQYGIPEPANGLEVPPQMLDVVFIPMLAFDIYGNRAGYGKGFYDRFLSQCRKDVLKIGLSFFEAEQETIPNNPTDIPLNICVTPDKTYQF
jgi:5-formyltetrahydrofolate cyclo-ligase